MEPVATSSPTPATPPVFPEQYRSMIADWRAMGMDDAEIAKRIAAFQEIDTPADRPEALPPLSEAERDMALKLIAERRTLLKAAAILLLTVVGMAVPMALIGYWLDGYSLHILILTLFALLFFGTIVYHRRTLPHSLLCAGSGVLYVILVFFFDTLLRVAHTYGAEVTWEVLRRHGTAFFQVSVEAMLHNHRIAALAIIYGVVMFFACRPSVDDGDLRRELKRHRMG